MHNNDTHHRVKLNTKLKPTISTMYFQNKNPHQKLGTIKLERFKQTKQKRYNSLPIKCLQIQYRN